MGALIFLAGIVAAVLALGLWIFGSIVLAQVTYATKVFDGVVPYDRVVASRRYHSLWRGPGFGCTYAVVALGEAASHKPPEPSRVRDGSFAYGGDWQPTPFDGLVDPPGDGPWRLCEIALGETTWAWIANSAAAPGGWVAWNERNGLSIYAPEAGLAALVRESD